jgi:hypothetical protein
MTEATPARGIRLLVTVVAVWLVFVFHSHLPALTASLHLERVDRVLRRSGAYDVVLVVWFAAVAWSVGRRLLCSLGVRAASRSEEAAFSLALGAAAFSLATMALAVAGGLYRVAAYALLVLATALSHGELERLRREMGPSLSARIRDVRWTAPAVGQALLALFVVVVLAVVLLSALGPSYEYDDLAYHLAGPKNFIGRHRVFPLYEVPNAQFPKNVEMLFTFGMLLHNDVTAKLIHLLLGLVTIVAVHGFAARYLKRGAGWIAAAVLACSPLFIWEMRTAHNDVGLALYVFAATYATCVWLWSGERSWFRLAVVLSVFSLGIKYWALLAVAISACLVFAVRLRQSGARPALRDAAKFAACAALGLIPWGIISLQFTGNPLFPLLNDLFRSPYWTRAHTTMAVEQLRSGGVQVGLTNLGELAGIWWRMLVDQSDAFGGNIGPFYVMLLPLFLLARRLGPPPWFVLAASTLYYAGWAASGPLARFLLPALPGLAVAAGAAAANWLGFLTRLGRGIAVAGALLLATLAIGSSPFFESFGAWPRYGGLLIAELPLRYLAGLESRSDVLARHYPGYCAVAYLNTLPGPRKVFYVHALPDGFYLDGFAAYHYSSFAPGLVDRSAEDVHRVLRKNGITHVLVCQRGQHSSPLSSRESEFTHRYLGKLFQQNAHIVYELLPAAVEQDAVACDFLDHLESATIEPDEAGRRAYAYGEIRAVRGDSRYAMAAQPHTRVAFTLTLCERPKLQFAVAKANPDCTSKKSVSVSLTAPEIGRRTIYRRDLEEESGRGWFDEQLDLAAYAGRRVTLMFQSDELGSAQCSDYLWADPVLVERHGIASAMGVALPRSEPTSRGEPTVSAVSITPEKVKPGESFSVDFSGTGLTEQTYFDVRFRAPGSLLHDVAANFQHGTSVRHTATGALRAGAWVITGVRAHRLEFDHAGEFVPVHSSVEVSR